MLEILVILTFPRVSNQRFKAILMALQDCNAMESTRKRIDRQCQALCGAFVTVQWPTAMTKKRY